MRSGRGSQSQLGRRVAFLPCLFYALTLSSVASGASTSEAPSVEFASGLLSARARNVPLADVLRETATATGLRIGWQVPLDAKVSTEFRRLPLEAGIRRLLSGYNFVLLYDEHASLTGSPGPQATLRGVEVLSHRMSDVKGTARKTRMRSVSGTHQNALRQTQSERTVARDDEQELREIGNQALFSPDAAAREDAVDDLSFADDEGYAARILTEVLEQDAEPDIRESALDALESLDPIPLQPVLDASVYDEAPEVRLRALEVIEYEEWNDQTTIQTLAMALEDASPEVRLTAVEILGDLEQRDVLEFAARANRDSAVRELAWDYLSDS